MLNLRKGEQSGPTSTKMQQKGQSQVDTEAD